MLTGVVTAGTVTGGVVTDGCVPPGPAAVVVPGSVPDATVVAAVLELG
jgi:hypothetical protein